MARRIRGRRARRCGARRRRPRRVLLAGCAKDAPQDTWQPAGHERPEDPEPAVAGVHHRRHRRRHRLRRRRLRASFRFRDRGQAIPEQTHGKPALEIALTILPALILVGVGVPTVSTLFALAKTERHPVRRQRHRPAVVVGVRLPGAGGLRRHHRRRSSPAASWSSPTDTNVLAARHQPRRDPLLLDPAAQRQARRGARPRPDAAHARPTSRASTPASAPSSAASRTPTCAWRSVAPERRRLRDVGGQPDRGVHAARAPARWPPTGEAHVHRRSARAATRSTGSTARRRRTPVHRQPRTSTCIAGAAPNLTHLMTRNTFAGATFDLLTAGVPRPSCGTPRRDEFGALYLQGVTPDCLNEVEPARRGSATRRR